jgi:hypothetical protein
MIVSCRGGCDHVDLASGSVEWREQLDFDPDGLLEP